MRISRSSTQTNPYWISNEILKVEVKTDNVQPFNTRWDETIISMKKQPDEESQEIFF